MTGRDLDSERSLPPVLSTYSDISLGVPYLTVWYVDEGFTVEDETIRTADNSSRKSGKSFQGPLEQTLWMVSHEGRCRQRCKPQDTVTPQVKRPQTYTDHHLVPVRLDEVEDRGD